MKKSKIYKLRIMVTELTIQHDIMKYPRFWLSESQLYRLVKYRQNATQ